MLVLFFLSSGLFLGWSLGANDAANIFGTGVGTKMVKFRTAAIVASIFVILGAVISGAGTTHTLGKLGAVDMIAGAFMVALSAAVTVMAMTRYSLPVSTSQAIVGAIIGWNLFVGRPTDINSLYKIALTWVMSPILAAGISILLFFAMRTMLNHWKLHLLRLDAYTRVGLIVVGAFGAYSLGANNIANVMGVFVPVAPFDPITVLGITFSGTQQLFLLGGIAIAVGIGTFSKRVMLTVGDGVVKLTPQTALVVVLAQAMVLFLFASRGLESWLLAHQLPTIPLVPVSSSQVVIGSVIGLGMLRGGSGIKFRLLGRIAIGWVATPVLAALIAFVSLFFLQNVFNQQVSKPIAGTAGTSRQVTAPNYAGIPIIKE